MSNEKPMTKAAKTENALTNNINGKLLSLCQKLKVNLLSRVFLLNSLSVEGSLSCDKT